MITFYFLVVVATIILWFLLSFLFPIVGALIRSIIKDAKVNIKKDFGNKKENENE